MPWWFWWLVGVGVWVGLFIQGGRVRKRPLHVKVHLKPQPGDDEYTVNLTRGVAYVTADDFSELQRQKLIRSGVMYVITDEKQ